MVHGVEETERAIRASAVLFGSSLLAATADEILTVFDDVPSVELQRIDLTSGVQTIDLTVKSGLASSRGSATCG